MAEADWCPFLFGLRDKGATVWVILRGGVKLNGSKVVSITWFAGVRVLKLRSASKAGRVIEAVVELSEIVGVIYEDVEPDLEKTAEF